MMDAKISTSQKVDCITKHLQTRYEGKKHGGYNIYEDEFIELSMDTYFPNWTIIVKLPEERLTVASGSNQAEARPKNFIPGIWQDYINDLYKKALNTKNNKETKETRDEINNQLKRDKEIKNYQNQMNKLFF